MNSVEMWKPIEGFEGRYEVSNLGRIKSLNYNHTGKEGFLKQKPLCEKKKYLVITLYDDEGRKKNYYTHILVAKAFIPNPLGLPEVNHKDENHMNPAADNLEWMTHADNIRYGTGIERGAAKRRKPVRCIELDQTYESVSAAAAAFGVSRASICKCAKGNQKTCCGYHWEYVEEDE